MSDQPPPFDLTETPTDVERPHAFSIGTQVPGARLLSPLDGSLPAAGGWTALGFRGVARSVLATGVPGARLRLTAHGSAFSLLRPADALTSGIQWWPSAGRLAVRIDGGPQRELSCTGGDEVLLAAGLAPGPHEIEVEAVGASPGLPLSDDPEDLDPGAPREAKRRFAEEEAPERALARWAIEGIRAWTEQPTVVAGRIEGGPLLADVRAEVSGPVGFSTALRDGKSGCFAFLVPAAGRYRLNLSAPGWEPASAWFEARPGSTAELPDIAMRAAAHPSVPPRALASHEPLVLVACGHCNTWGTEPAEWLARRVEWINAQRPHAMLLANEVNPAYVAGALVGLACPWLITDGNHRHPAFGQGSGDAHHKLQIGPARIVTADRDVAGNAWRGVLARFGPEDRLRIVCAYEPFAPPDLLEAAGVRLYFYGHDLSRPPYWTRGGTTFLRKIDSQTFYRIEVGPPHGAAAPVRVQRFIFSRAE